MSSLLLPCVEAEGFGQSGHVQLTPNLSGVSWRLTYPPHTDTQKDPARESGQDHRYQTPSVCVLILQLCPTLCDPMDSTLPGSSVHGISQARILERVVMPSSRDQPGVSYFSCIVRWVLYH